MRDDLFKTYPDIPWKSGWRLYSGPGDLTPFLTGVHGSLAMPEQSWTLQLIDPDESGPVCLFANGLSIGARRQPGRNRIDVRVAHPGVLCGTVQGLPPPRLTAEQEIKRDPDVEWLASGAVLLLKRDNRFALVSGEAAMERALAKADAVLDEDPDALFREEDEDRKNIIRLFSINPRHNPPVLLAAETLTARLRERTGALHGLWSRADGFDGETFSLNELYPLIRAWRLIDPSTAVQLMQTVMSLQQSAGGFPAWAAADGSVATVAPWPLIAQSFEQMWLSAEDPALLRKYLPSLRKYVLWALRRFDPHRDLIPAWQSEQEVFVPGSFERGKATPELTVMLINEFEAVMRLCEKNGEPASARQSLAEERDSLVRTLNTIFWNPELNAFSNVWKDGHYLHEPSFGSFMPLCWRGLETDRKNALLERFEETHGFPGKESHAAWDMEDMDDTVHRPAIHHFMAFEALLSAEEAAKGMRMLFMRHARDGFAGWFERTAFHAEPSGSTGESAYSLGPVTASLILTTQHEFVIQAAKAPTSAQLFLRIVHRLRLRTADLRIVLGVLLASLLAHQIYALRHSHDEKTQIAEAALNYRQGRFEKAMSVFRRYPDNIEAKFLQANIFMFAQRPDLAEPLYRQALKQNYESPSALLGLALALHMNGNLELAAKRYGDFIEIHGALYPDAAQIAAEFQLLAREGFGKPPGWRRIYEQPLMNRHEP